tara:strand:- start:1032 stop:1382 length:351 start_codon:yes stop_codon:yes gene_type:complete
MDFSMQNTGIGGNVENEDDLQVMADKVVQEDSEELVFEETETDLEMKDEDIEKKDNTITIMGFTLEQNHLYMLVGLLLVVVFFFYKDQIMEFVNGLGLFDSSASSAPTPEPFNKEQ